MDRLVWTPVKIKLGAIRPWSDNPRYSTKAQAERLIESEKQLGQPQTLAISPFDESGMADLYDGHQRYMAWMTVKGKDFEVWALQSSRYLTDEERRKAVIMLHAGAVGAWNWDELSNWDTSLLKQAGMDSDLLAHLRDDTRALAAMLESERAGGDADAEPEIDRAEELREKWGVETGQLWQIGEHRLICGDCTDSAVVERLMGGDVCELVVTDPPYGVSYSDKNGFLNAIDDGNRIQTEIQNDNKSKDEMQAIWKAAFCEMSKVMGEGASIYCFMPQGGDQMMMMMMMMMMGAGIEPRHELIWVKNNHVLGRSDYNYKHEPILYAWKEGGHKFYGGFQTSVFEFDKPQKSDLHPTMKPVALVEKLIQNSSVAGDMVYDQFCGSGTTMVACQNLGRKCRAVEISPAYCAVILERMATAFPGIEIKRLTQGG
jgi:DNA modification methylase